MSTTILLSKMDKVFCLLASISKKEINRLPLISFDGPIQIIDNLEDAEAAVDYLLKTETILGFDTETKPAFVRGEYFPTSLVQLASEKSVYIFRLKEIGGIKPFIPLLANPRIIKAGIAINEDIRKLKELEKFESAGIIEISELTNGMGIETASLRGLAAIFLKYRISKSVQCSDWSRTNLTKKQVVYAATDAWISRELYVRVAKLGYACYTLPEHYKSDFPCLPGCETRKTNDSLACGVWSQRFIQIDNKHTMAEINRQPLIDRLSEKTFHVKDTEELCSLENWTDEYIRADNNPVLQKCAAKGKLEIIKWLILEFSLTVEDIRLPDTFSSGYTTFQWCLYGGHLACAIWLTDTFNLTVQDARFEIERWGFTALAVCVYNGHTECAKWLVNRFNLTIEDARLYYDYGERIFQCCIMSGHLDCAKWFVSHFGLTVEDARSDDNAALRGCMGNGKLDCAKWLVSYFGLNTTDAQSIGMWKDTSLYCCMRDNELECAKWLVGKFSLTSDGANNLLHVCVVRGRLECTKWLISYFNLTEYPGPPTKNPFCNVPGNRTLHFAMTNGHFESVAHLIWYFSLDSDFEELEIDDEKKKEVKKELDRLRGQRMIKAAVFPD